MIYDGLVVADVSTGIAGGYCSKLLTDLGFDVVKIEPEGGDPLRTGSPELFSYLHTSQRSVVIDDPRPWVESAAVAIESFTPGVFESMGLMKLARVTVSISSFGRGGPDSTLDLPEEVLQARSGSLSNHGHMDKPPLTVGGRLGEYVTGAYAALGAVTAWRRARRTGVRETVDVSMLEAMQYTMVTTPTLFSRFPGGFLGTVRWVMIPGNEPAGDGNFVGITTVTAQQWRSLLQVMGHPELAADEELTTMLGRFKRKAEVTRLLEEFTTSRTAEEVVELCAAARVPAAVVGNGELLPRFDQLRDRGVFVTQPGESWVRPRAPFRISAVPDRELTPAPALGEHSADARRRAPDPARGIAGSLEARPLAGLRVLDFTTFWSGPYATAWLAAMGADVIKVESTRHPDGIRLSAAVRPDQDERYYEMTALFHATNLAKRGITLDLAHPAGLELAKRLIKTADVLVENFTPRVMDGFGLTYHEVSALRPEIVYVRLPAFGLSGPWRDRPGFAQTMEQLSGMAWVTGYEGGPPIIPGGFVDPAVGVHTATALVAALEHRDRTGEGSLVEMPMIEVAVAMTAEQVIEFSAHGRVVERRGEGGVYQCQGKDAWVAVDRARDPMRVDERAEWCAGRTPEDAAQELMAEGIPAAAMVPAFATLDDPQLRARGFFEPLGHPVVGEHEYPGWPMRFSSPGPEGWWTGPAPTLGQHNEEVLRELGVTDEELAYLHAEGVIGERPTG